MKQNVSLAKMWPGVMTLQFLFYMSSKKICEMKKLRKGNEGTVLKRGERKKNDELAMV